ncbi:hypothetical protein MNEG_16213 [Monoraphidium neglectum]|uniref:Uncharacterized protein n=1 Tax=Monoraphidium neglectum TaxID=145388 RepID=A0A0D2LP34_9CHLO|nr:hypothetical protein MNEG_16213 [Monoraphidium neglectum]KIY91751.1 hypothetical protein MNEG_16213 [Monoraphidium neglectum]|eukprot:XP_013890771.1 hypothetical protein MNEG_16213 [Monoraphidium neglectum]
MGSPGRLHQAGRSKAQDPDESVSSFASGPAPVKPAVYYAWKADQKVDHESFQRMLAEYRTAKDQQKSDQLKIRQWVA